MNDMAFCTFQRTFQLREGNYISLLPFTQVTWLPSLRSEARGSNAQALIYLLVGGAPWWVLLQHSIMLRLFFIIKYGIVRFLCVYSPK